jgi:CO dehydrogenase/acetyl-CoA synthase beta subunit
MHGQTNIKLCNAKKAKRVYQDKNTKIKLYKNNAAIWYNETCMTRQITPTYANINVKGKNSRCHLILFYQCKIAHLFPE